ncbi:hypothetical protein Sta7437_1541 [Stanieria cyanosphaera PCC 7437]|uniref:Uncharacterized protein n=1 Tax=Stanieria cyanosphaera (strain ATCC 29371 / PCC 7437) TaxID=111780 RepID=K9XRG9_STAC7|nr:hypothetical protein [Stanieria cyanosphaera]AFZ35108.1 hypothetical protein Sta7437_1541 [Stanieria cyanosphaera PCC 7437]
MSVQLTIKPQTKYYFANPNLPLAVYREVVAHLRQVEGVEVGLISYPVTSQANESQDKFNYHQSQIKALWIESPQAIEPSCQERLIKILDYYAQRYEPWQQLTTK